jgi:hypothetical protein
MRRLFDRVEFWMLLRSYTAMIAPARARLTFDGGTAFASLHYPTPLQDDRDHFMDAHGRSRLRRTRRNRHTQLKTLKLAPDRNRTFWMIHY